MENRDTVYLIFRNLSVFDIIRNCNINKIVYNTFTCVLQDRIKLNKYFNRYKNRTLFQKKNKRRRTYYTLKNKYQNKEETPILTT